MRQSHGKVETDEELDNRYIAYFERPNIDGWEIRKAMNDLTVSIGIIFVILNSVDLECLD